jgi:hypothetical protein
MGLLLRPFRALGRAVVSLLRKLRNLVIIVTVGTAVVFILDRVLFRDEEDDTGDSP